MPFFPFGLFHGKYVLVTVFFCELPGWRIKPSLPLVTLLLLSHRLELLQLRTSHHPLFLLTLATTILLGLILLWKQGALITILFFNFPIST